MSVIKENVTKAAEKEATKVSRTKVTKKPADEAAKKPIKKSAAKKSVNPVYVLQCQSSEVPLDTLTESIKKAYVESGEPHGEIKKLEIYLKPEENAAYYVVNGFGSDEQKVLF